MNFKFNLNDLVSFIDNEISVSSGAARKKYGLIIARIETFYGNTYAVMTLWKDNDKYYLSGYHQIVKENSLKKSKIKTNNNLDAKKFYYGG